MVRKPDKAKYRKLPCLLYKPNAQPKKFWASAEEHKNVSNNIGQPMTDSYNKIETMSDLDFQINDKVQINGGRKLTIEDEYGRLDEDDNNCMRGKPRYIKVLVIR